MSRKYQHNFNDMDTPIRNQGAVFEKVVIGEDSWVGNGILIYPDVTL